MRPTSGGALLDAGPSTAQPTARFAPSAPIGPLAFLGVAIVSFGGPLALAALYAPIMLDDASASGGLIALVSAAVFGLPMIVWLRYARDINSSGGLYSFVEAAAGRRVALVQAGLWILSYTLYIVYTTAQIVYDTLPIVLPGVRPYQPLLEIAIPVLIAGVMLAGRAVTLVVLGALAVGQLALVGALAGVTIGHDAPASAFGAHVPAGSFSSATGDIALLYICGTLPLFLGGEVARPARTVRRGMVGAYLLAAAAVTAAVFPLAENPAFTRAAIPGMAVAEVFANHSLAVAIGVGVAASIAGGMLVEYLALSRLLHAVTARSVGAIIAVLAVLMVGAAPFSLLNPDKFYDSMLKPSLAALWLSQLIVFAVFPRFVARRGGARLPAVALALAASAVAVYGLYGTVHNAAT